MNHSFIWYCLKNDKKNKTTISFFWYHYRNKSNPIANKIIIDK